MPLLRGRRALSGSVRRSRPRYEWLVAASNLTAVGANTTSVFTIASAAALEEFPRCTILRIRGSLTVNPATSPAAASGYVVWMGIAALTSDSAGWDPETNIEFPWMWHEMIAPQMGGTGVSNDNSSRWAAYFRIAFDVRAKRKTQENTVVQLLVKNSNQSAAAVQFLAVSRCLVLVGH